MTITLRVPAAEDADEIAALHVRTWRETYGNLLPADFFTPEFSRARRESWRARLSAAASEWTVCVATADDHRIVGFAMSGPAAADRAMAPPRDRQLYNLYTSADQQGTGVGSRLLEAVLGADPAVLWVAAQNPHAIAFYLRHGFLADGVERTDTVIGLREERMVR